MSYAGAATNFVGGIIQALAAKKAQEQMYRTYTSQLKKQRGFQNEMFTNFGQQAPAIYSVEAAKNTLGQGQDVRQQEYQKIQNNPALIGAALPTGQAKAAGDMASQRSAGYAAYSDLGPKQSLGESVLGDTLRRTGFRSQGAAQVFPLQMQHAQHSMDWLSMIGMLISSIGSGAQNWSQFNQQPSGDAIPASQSQQVLNEYYNGR